MAIRCVNCGYKMKTSQELQSAIVKSGYDISDWVKSLKGVLITVAAKVIGIFLNQSIQNLFAGHLNTGPNKVRCPYCGGVGRWEDI